MSRSIDVNRGLVLTGGYFDDGRERDLYRLATLVNDVDKRNKAFFEMTPEQRRVAIAKDVIARLDTQQFRTGGGYFGFTRFDYDSLNAPAPLDEVIGDRACVGCALGGLIVSTLKVFNGVSAQRKRSVGQTDIAWTAINDAIGEVLPDYFSPEQLSLIEHAFECWPVHERDGFGTFRYLPEHAADVTGDSSPRLRRIMENIVENNGTFVIKPEEWHAS